MPVAPVSQEPESPSTDPSQDSQQQSKSTDPNQSSQQQPSKPPDHPPASTPWWSSLTSIPNPQKVIDSFEQKAGNTIESWKQGAEKQVDHFRDYLSKNGGTAGKIASTVIGFQEGGANALYDAGKGLVQLADGASKVVNPLEWAANPQANIDRLKTTGNAAWTLTKLATPVGDIVDPKGKQAALKAIGDSVVDSFKKDPSKAAGYTVGTIATFFVPGGGEASAATDVARAGVVANDVTHAAQAANAVDHVTQVANAADHVSQVANTADHAAQVANTADHTAQAVNTVDHAVPAANTTDRAVQTVTTADRTAETAPGAIKSTQGKYPDFNPTQGKTNCHACTDALDNFKAGKGFKPAPDVPADWPKNPIAPWDFKTDPASIEQTVAKAGDGARGTVYMSDGADAHVFLVENQGGVVNAIDAQSGLEGPITELAQKAGYSGPNVTWGYAPTHLPAEAGNITEHTAQVANAADHTAQASTTVDHVSEATSTVDQVSEAPGAGRKFGPKAGESEPNWGSHLRSIKGDPPLDMERPHAHHTVFKSGIGSQKPWLEQSKDILEKYNIDWYKGRENLDWAPNVKGVHTTENAKIVYEELKAADETFGTKQAIIDTLKDLQQRFAQGSLK